MSKSKPHVRLITFFVCASACLLRTVRMQLNFPIAVITAIAFAFGLVADVASSFSLSRSLINPSTLLDKSSDGVGIFIANDAMTYHGGNFVRALAHAAVAADPENLELIKQTWPEIWTAYANWPLPMEPHL